MGRTLKLHVSGGAGGTAGEAAAAGAAGAGGAGVAGTYLHKHDHTLAQDLADRSFVVVVALKNLLLQKLPGGQVEGLVGSVEPAAVQPLLPWRHRLHTFISL